MNLINTDPFRTTRQRDRLPRRATKDETDRALRVVRAKARDDADYDRLVAILGLVTGEEG